MRPTGYRATIAALVLCLLGFALLTVAVLAGATEGIDRAAVIWLRRAGQPDGPAGPLTAGTAMIWLTWLGSRAVLGPVSLAVAGFLALRRRWRDLVFLAAAATGGLGLSPLVKLAVGRARPDLVAHVVTVSSDSFPSGHATDSAIAAVAFCFLLMRPDARPASRGWLVAAAALLVLLIGFSRVYLGVHYPSDVLAGWCLGAGWVLACWLATRPRSVGPATAEATAAAPARNAPPPGNDRDPPASA